MLISRLINFLNQANQLQLRRNDQARALTVQMKKYAIHCITLASLITAIKRNS